ncbi:MAG: HEAT repeat domain-containing protein [Planctomycetaceae bacterium]
MTRHSTLPMFVAMLLSCCLPSLAEEVTVGAYQLRIPDGFQIEPVTTPDLVERPIAMSFDEQGALYVTDSAGMSDRADRQLELKPHRIRRLTDTNDDGVFDHSTLFADGMMFPEGCLWYEGSLYVAAPPHIWKLTDTDGDGQCDERSIWYDGQTLTGCGNDLHGPYLSPDGWFYWCKGAFAEQTHQINGRDFTTRSSHIFRSLPDGSRMESVLTGGMDNPVNVAFLADGERFLSCTFFQHPANGRRDGLIHSIYGGVYGKDHASIYEHPMTGSVMPVMTHMGAAAPCGLLALDHHDPFWGTRQQRLLACYFNLHKVVDHQLERSGSTFITHERDLVACDHPDFHPTDVQLAPDGSVLIVDTGGWYKICCPTSQLAKPDVFGAIYRLKRKDQPKPDDPLGHRLAWNDLTETELVDLLNDSRTAVRERAVRSLRRRGRSALPALRDGLTHTVPVIRSRVIRVLAGMDLPDARSIIQNAPIAEVSMRDACLNAISLWRDAEGFDVAAKFVTGDNMRTARLAAEALGRLNDRRATSKLLTALSLRNFLPTDFDETGSPTSSAVRVREHAFINALIELGDPEGTQPGLQSDNPRVVRGALVALDQMPGHHLTPAAILPLLRHEDVSVARTAAWVAGHHSDWGQALVEFYTAELNQVTPDSAVQLTEQLGRLAKSVPIQNLLQQTLETGSPDQKRAALRAMTASALPTVPQGWLDEAAATLPKLSSTQKAEAIAEIRLWPAPKEPHAALNKALLQVAHDATIADVSRFDALQICSPLKDVPDSLLMWLIKALNSDPEQGLRLPAADVLAKASLTPDQQSQLLPVLRHSGPFELAALLPAFASNSDQFGQQFLTAMETSPGFQGIRVDQLQAVLTKYPASTQDAGRKLLTRLNASVEQQTAHLESLLADLKPGDARRGHEIFNSKVAKCITCHARGYNGGRLGPDLTNIGKVRNTRDLLEAIIYPSASLVRGYEPVTVVRTSGLTESGIIRSEDRDNIVLAIDADKVRNIPRSEIEEIQPASVSLMPQGMDKVLTTQDLADLIAFLQQ